MRDVFSDVPETDPDYQRPSQQHWSSDPRRSSQYIALRRQFREACRMHRNADGSYGAKCSECGDPIV